MLPGQTYTPEYILRLLWKGKWMILIPFVLTASAAAAYTWTLPNRYRSQTNILVVPQRIPESYVKSTVTARIEDRLTTIQQQILSRSRLEGVITEFNLYPEWRRALTMEDVVERMALQVEVQIQRGDAFSIAYISEDPGLAQKVTDRLASMFINENTQDREMLAEGTNVFLDGQLEDARRRLVEQEQRLAEYRRAHTGELPSQVETNLRAIQTAQIQLQSLDESINKDKDRRLGLQRQLADAERTPATPVITMPAPAAAEAGAVPVTGTTAQMLEAATARLLALQQRYTREHPDVRAAGRQVDELTAKLQAEAALQPARKPEEPARPVSPAEIARQRNIESLRDELEMLDGQIARKESDTKRLRDVIASYQAKVESAPMRDTEMVEMTRDYATLQALYNNLATKREDAKLAASLERRQVGEQFKVLDPARVPERPFSPNRVLLNLVGAMAGLGFGLGLVGLGEYRDRTLKREADVVRVLQVPVLAIVPVMASATTRSSRRGIIAATVAFLVIVVAAGAYAAWRAL